jgi:hypothetical protein
MYVQCRDERVFARNFDFCKLLQLVVIWFTLVISPEMSDATVHQTNQGATMRLLLPLSRKLLSSPMLAYWACTLCMVLCSFGALINNNMRMARGIQGTQENWNSLWGCNVTSLTTKEEDGNQIETQVKEHQDAIACVLDGARYIPSKPHTMSFTSPFPQFSCPTL